MNIKHLLFVTSLILLASCCPEVDQETFEFDIATVSPKNFNHNTIEFVNGNNISASQYALIVETTAPEILNAQSKSRGGGIFRSPDCDKDVDPIFQLADNVVNIDITSTADISPSHPSGSNLNELFTPIRITKDNPFSEPPSLVEEFSGGIVSFDFFNSELVNHHDAIDFRNQDDTSFYGFRFTGQLSSSIQIQFRLELTFESGRKISGLTAPITLEN